MPNQPPSHLTPGPSKCHPETTQKTSSIPLLPPSPFITPSYSTHPPNQPLLNPITSTNLFPHLLFLTAPIQPIPHQRTLNLRFPRQTLPLHSPVSTKQDS